MSFQDLQRLCWDGENLCPECGDALDGDNVSVEYFERSGGLLRCVDCDTAEWDDEDEEADDRDPS